MTSRDIYIKATATFADTTDIKALIPDAGARRRMSRLIKMGVATGMECVTASCTPDAIVTATGYGFLTDSEKLLQQLTSTGEELMSPTPFMQSTFNTIGSQIALMTGCRGANMTFADGWRSFGAALIFSHLLISSGEAHDVLVVAADELTPSLDTILTRLGCRRMGVVPTEGAVAMMLSADAEKSIGTIGAIEPLTVNAPVEKNDWQYPTASARRLASAIESRSCGTFEAAGIRCTLSF